MKNTLFISLIFFSSSAVFAMEDGKIPARTGLMSMAEMVKGLEDAGVIEKTSQCSPDSIITHNGIQFSFDDPRDLVDLRASIEASEARAKLQEYFQHNTSQPLISQATPVVETPYTRCYFTPDIQNAFLNCIDKEKKGMRGAFFRFTLYQPALRIAQGIRARELAVKLIIDRAQWNYVDDYSKKLVESNDFASPLKLIIDNGGVVCKMDKKRFAHIKGHFEIMHHKFMIFESIDGKKLLWNGSWNVTGQASSKSSENVMVTDNQDAIAAFEKEYAVLESFSSPVPSAECVTKRDNELGGSANFGRVMNGIPELK
jgi:hypothetical protein